MMKKMSESQGIGALYIDFTILFNAIALEAQLGQTFLGHWLP
jgi:hypothetical protein